LISRKLISACVLLAASTALAQPTPEPVTDIYVYLSWGLADPDVIAEVQRGIRAEICAAGMTVHFDGPERASDLKVDVVLSEANYGTDFQAQRILGRCRLKDGNAVLPSGTSLPIPEVDFKHDEAIPHAGNGGGARAARSFFRSCGGEFGSQTLDALKDRIAVSGPGC